MNALVAYLAARDRTAEIAQGARPHSPVQPEHPARSHVARHRVSMALHRLADRLAPAPAPVDHAPTRAGSPSRLT